MLYNNVPGGFAGTLGAGNTSTIVAISLSQEDGTALLPLVGQNAAVSGTLTQPASGACTVTWKFDTRKPGTGTATFKVQ